MKLTAQHNARALREKGMSIKAIAQTLGVSKGSVSLWVRDVRLSARQTQILKTNPHNATAVERRRQSRLQNEERKRNHVIDQATDEIVKPNIKELFYLGLALYWGEGTKRKRGVVEFTNSDPDMIRIMMVFFKKICKVSKHKFRGHVYLHEHLDARRAIRYWSNVSSIPLSQFHKTSIQHNKKRLSKDTLPYGTFAIIVCDTELKLRITGWTQGLINTLT